LAQLGTPGSQQDPEDSKSSTQHSSTSSSNDATSTETGSALRPRNAARLSRTRHTVPSANPTAGPPTRNALARRVPANRKKMKGGIANIVVMTLAAGLIATVALPAYAFNPATNDQSQFGSSVIDGMKKAQSQSVTIPSTTTKSVVARDAVTATSEAELQAAKAAQAAEAAREAAAAQMVTYAASYSGPSASDFLSNPPYPNFSLSQVFSVAQQYIGTPYVYGGDTPAGFDCSGYIMFVYAQFGISLPHSVSGQAASGTRISVEDAVPGDIVIMSGHDGFYAGNGNIMDAPDVGRSVSIRPIWTSDYYIVRLGI
jgi:peptidoglycan DL-endopeptidase CwlO